ncbi:MAG: J domain-containing protein [Legionellaceae bacterium]|nr:J domain-containing protein [Legionellaceae bacterium]
MKNLYLLLGITKEATSQDIKKAYRKIALDNHPDRGGDVEKMALVNEAYEILSDSKKREKFDADWEIFQASDVDYEADFTPKGFLKAGNLLSYSHVYKEQHKSLVIKYALTPMQEKKHGECESFKSGLYHIEEQGGGRALYDDIFTFIQAKEATLSEEIVWIAKDRITIAIAIKLFKDFLSGNYFGNALKDMKRYLTSEIAKLKVSDPHAAELSLYEAIDEIVSMTHQASLDPNSLLLSLGKISDFAKNAANVLLPGIIPLFSDKFFRNLYKNALHLYWDTNHDLLDKNHLEWFDGLQETKELLQALRKRLSTGDSNENVSKYIQYITLLYTLEKDIHKSDNIEQTAENCRHSAFHLMDWMPVFIGRSSKEILVNLFLQIGLTFQQASVIEDKAAFKQADEQLALKMYLTAIGIGHHSTPDIENYANAQVIKYISAFQFEDLTLNEVIPALKKRALIIADVFPFFENAQSNVAFLKKENRSLHLMRYLLQVMTNRYEYNKNHSDGIPLEHSAIAILYSAYEACLKNWFQENYDPAVEKKFRLDLMDELLFANNWTFLDVEERLNSPWIMVGRDDKGWIKPTRSLPYKDESEGGFVTYRSINGAEVNAKTGEINFLMTPWTQGRSAYEKVFTLFDLQEMLEKNIGGAFFSLDPVDANMEYHPFNVMRFAPSQLCDSELLNTMLLTDYILKFLTTNQEVNGEYPFEQRPVTSMIQHLPEYLRKIIDDFNAAQHTGALHRFWIEAEEIDINISDPDNTANKEDITTIGLGHLRMVVKKHRIERDIHGELKDVGNEDEGWPIYVLTPEQVQELTQGERVINGHAMIYVYKKAQLFYWENHAILHTHIPTDYRETLIRLFLQPRDDTGKIEQTAKNSALIYRSTKAMASQSGISHRYSPEFIFAHEFTTHYDEFAQYLPEFGRLKELSKMSALIRILGGIRQHNKEELDALHYLTNTADKHTPPKTDTFKRYHQVYQESRDHIISDIQNIRAQISNSISDYKVKQIINLKQIQNQINPLVFDANSEEVRKARNHYYECLVKANPLLPSFKIWDAVPSKTEMARTISREKRDSVFKQLVSAFSACLVSAGAINDFMDGNMSKLLSELIVYQTRPIREQIGKNFLHGSSQDIEQAICDNDQKAIERIANEETRHQLMPIRKIKETCESGFAQIHFGKEDKEVDLSGQCFWVPASVRHDVDKDHSIATSRHSFFVYGGVSIQSRININRGGNRALEGNRVGAGAFNRAKAIKATTL